MKDKNWKLCRTKFGVYVYLFQNHKVGIIISKAESDVFSFWNICLWVLVGLIGLYLFGLRTGRAIKLHKKGRDFRVPEKNGEKNKTKQKWGGDITTGRTNRSNFGFSVIHRDIKPPYSKKSKFQSDDGLHSQKTAQNQGLTACAFQPN